jgi:uncharacterized membrane protein
MVQRANSPMHQFTNSPIHQLPHPASVLAHAAGRMAVHPVSSTCQPAHIESRAMRPLAPAVLGRRTEVTRGQSEGGVEMERMLVVVFDGEDKAYKAAKVLEGLKDLSLIALNADAIVTKNPQGEATVAHPHTLDPQATMGGTAVGTLIGIFGGPVGLFVGAVTGALIGASADLVRARVGNDFLTEVTDALEPGKTALVAEIDEEETDPIDHRMSSLGGRVFRRDLQVVEDNAYEREVAAMNANSARIRAEYAEDRSERKRQLQARVDALKKKLAMHSKTTEGKRR